MNGFRTSDIGGASDVSGRVSLKRKPAISSIGGSRSFSKPISKMFPRRPAKNMQMPASGDTQIGAEGVGESAISGLSSMTNSAQNVQTMDISNPLMTLPKKVLPPTGLAGADEVTSTTSEIFGVGSNPMIIRSQLNSSRLTNPGPIISAIGGVMSENLPQPIMEQTDEAMSPYVKSQQISTKSQMKNMFSNASGMKPFIM
jgi:hypothetical protein